MSGDEPQLVIRKGAPADLGEVIKLERACFDDPWSLSAVATELRPDALRRPLVAILGGEVVGYLMAWSVVDQLHILNVAIAPARRRGGVASALLGVAMDRARACGLTEATLEVRVGNSGARSFYERHGFVEVARRPHYYADNGEDALIMNLALAAPGD